MRFVLSECVRAEIDAWRKKFPPQEARSSVLYALRVVQEEHGWLPTEAMDAVADYLGVAPMAVYEVATFYSMYHLKPVGRHKISVCTNISCMLCGANQIAAYLKKRLGVAFGETTADGRFTLQAVECLAACAGGPVLMVNDKHYHERLTPEAIDALLDGLV